MTAWDVFAYIGMVAVLAAAWYAMRRLDRKARAKSREKAYQLLDMDNPPVKELKKTIRELQLYGGRMKRDLEFLQLRERLSRKLDAIEYQAS